MTVSRMRLAQYDEDYAEVTELFNRSNQTKEFRFEIQSIEKVINHELLRKFERKKTEYKNRYGHVRVVKVFHGTKKANIPSILQHNLKVELHGRNIGHRFGAGVSFSAFASYSSHYCDKSEGDNQMLLCHVLVSNIVEVPERRGRQPVLTHPPLLEGHNSLRYDTTAKNEEALDVIVKFEDHTFYPAFVINFRRVSKLSPSSFGSPFIDNPLSNMPRRNSNVATSGSYLVGYSQPPRGISSSSVCIPIRQEMPVPYLSHPLRSIPQSNLAFSTNSRHHEPTFIDSILSWFRALF